MGAEEDKDRTGESRLILERMARENEPLQTSAATRAARKFADHVAAADADEADPIEKWGTRIGRGIGLAVTAAMLLCLLWLVLGRG